LLPEQVFNQHKKGIANSFESNAFLILSSEEPAFGGYSPGYVH